MRSFRNRIVVTGLVVLLVAGLSSFTAGGVAVAQYTEAEAEGFNDEYLFATTKSVHRMEGVNPALKLTLYPVTIVLDTVFLPFAIVAGYIT